jgi:RNA polymerase sigma-70 factor (ECF subfamily)
MQIEAEFIGALPKLRAYASSLSHRAERVDDLVQETMVRAFANISSFEPGSNVMAWLYTILRNEFYSEYRKNRREVQDEDGQHANQVEFQQVQEGHMHFLEVRDAVERLAPSHREALMLTTAGGLSYGDAATQCGCAVGAIRSRIHRARGELAVLLGDRAWLLCGSS